jgi:hypothetical protein
MPRGATLSRPGDDHKALVMYTVYHIMSGDFKRFKNEDLETAKGILKTPSGSGVYYRFGYLAKASRHWAGYQDTASTFDFIRYEYYHDHLCGFLIRPWHEKQRVLHVVRI